MIRFKRVLFIVLLLGCLGVQSFFSKAAAAEITIRGYYFTFSRMPTFSFETWKTIVDGIHHDRGNMVLLWIGGGFRSRKFPITWEYNREHRNLQKDFVRDLIDYAHSKGIKVLMGLTPFSYDGVNQYPLRYPELKAIQANGRLVGLSGIHCWGYAMNPSRARAQQFMLEYTRELIFDFYPNADGLMIESSDYAICHCEDCKGSYYQKEFQFVKRISEEIWQKNPRATILVYPHYFTGRSVPGFEVRAAAERFDPRWTLFFTPHSAHVDLDLLKQARSAIYWDSSPVLKTPPEIQKGALTALKFGISGYVPSLEAFSFVAAQPEGGESFVVGKRQKPFGFEWMPAEENPYEELLIRVNRIAYREFTQAPGLDYQEFQSRLGREIFGNSASHEATEDLLSLQASFFADRSWFSASPMVSPDLLEDKLRAGSLSLGQLRDYRDRLEHLRKIAQKYARSSDPARREIHRIAAWISTSWAGEEHLLSDPLRSGE
ncbi:MAG: hypothetical protein AB1898_27175 [Acidobacteriota bacterium]